MNQKTIGIRAKNISKNLKRSVYSLERLTKNQLQTHNVALFIMFHVSAVSQLLVVFPLKSY